MEMLSQLQSLHLTFARYQTSCRLPLKHAACLAPIEGRAPYYSPDQQWGVLYKSYKGYLRQTCLGLRKQHSWQRACCTSTKTRVQSPSAHVAPWVCNLSMKENPWGLLASCSIEHLAVKQLRKQLMLTSGLQTHTHKHVCICMTMHSHIHRL